MIHRYQTRVAQPNQLQREQRQYINDAVDSLRELPHFREKFGRDTPMTRAEKRATAIMKRREKRIERENETRRVALRNIRGKIEREALFGNIHHALRLIDDARKSR